MTHEERILKYHRVKGAITNVLNNEIITAADVYDSGLVVGSTGGFVYILDELGNAIRTLKPHTRAVNAIYVDISGELMISCSEDGSVAITELNSTTEQENVLQFNEPVTAVCFDGQYHVKREKSFAIGLNFGQLIQHKETWFTQKKVTLFQGAGTPVSVIAWRGPLIAWADSTQVRILDVEHSTPVCFIPRPESIATDLYYPSVLCWESDSDLLIGWADTFRRLEMVHSITNGADSAQSSVNAEITEEWKADLIICGLSPLDSDSFILLGYVPSDTPEESERPEMQIVARGTGELIQADSLPINDYERNSPRGYKFCTTYKLRALQKNFRDWQLRDVTSIRGGMRGLAPVMYIASPADVIKVRVRDTDDRIAAALRNNDIEEAVNLAAADKSSLRRNSLQALIQKYFDLLLENQQAEKAAHEARRLLGSDTALWDHWIMGFAKKDCLVALAPFIPTDHPRLSDAMYEVVLNKFMVSNTEAFLATVRRWGHKQPPLYDIHKLLKTLEGGLAVTRKDPWLLQAQAELCIISKQYQKALLCYLEMDNSQQNMDDTEAAKHFRYAFDLIERKNLFESVQDKIYNLVKLSKELAGSLLVRNLDQFPVPLVANQLQEDRELLLWYLHLMFTKCQEQYNSEKYAEYLAMQVSLYAEFAPPFEKPALNPAVSSEKDDDALILPATYKPYESDFLTFLKTCSFASFAEAAAVCDHRDPPLYYEKAYALARTNNTMEALRIYVVEIGDIRQAIDFIVATDKALWPDLVKLCLDNDQLLASLLEYIGYYSLNPVELLRQIAADLKVDHLRRKLLKVVRQYGFQVFLHQGAKRILQSDTLALLRTYNQGQRRAFKIDPGTRCPVCGKPLFLPAGPPVGDLNPQQFPISFTSDASLDVWGKQDPMGAVALSSRSVLHRPCLDYIMREGPSLGSSQAFQLRNGSVDSSGHSHSGLTSPTASLPSTGSIRHAAELKA